MQALLDQFNTLLLSWKAITIQHTLLDLIIMGLISAIGLWFLLALYYHAKMTKARKRNQKAVFLIEQERAQLSATLDATAQQLVQTEQVLGDNQQQLQVAQAAADRGAALENQVAEAFIVLQSGALAQESLLDDSPAASSWERYHAAVEALISRMQTLQQEKTRLNAVLTDNALTIRSLQQENAGQQAQIGVLEQDIEKQQEVVQELQQSVLLLKEEVAKASVPLSVALVQSVPTHEAVIQAQTESSDTLFEKISDQVSEAVEEVVDGIESALHAVEQAMEPDLPVPADNQPSEVKAVEKPAPTSKLKEMFSFGKSTPSPEPVSANAVDDKGKLVTEADGLLLLEQVSNASDYGKSKFKSALGRFGKSDSPKQTEAAVKQDSPEAIAVIAASSTAAESLPNLKEGKEKSIFGRFGKSDSPKQTEAVVKQDSPEAIAVTAASSTAVESLPNLKEGKAKSIFGRFGKSDSPKQTEAAVKQDSPEVIAVTAASSTAAESLPNLKEGKAKSIFGRFGKSDPVPQSVSVAEPVKPEDVVPVTASSSTEASGFKLKNLLKGFNKESIAEYVETALEKNDAEVAEQLSVAEEELAASPAKSKSFWQKMTFTK